MNKPIVVCKFGGSSLASPDMVRKAAVVVRRRKEAGHGVVVVVSARGTTTDRLISEMREFAPNGSPREADMFISSGERMSAAIMSMALSEQGVSAVSLTGSQAGIITDDNHTNARIIEVRPSRVLHCLEAGRVVVVSGFQGVSFRKDVTTLGRGGSDVTAVAMARALDARQCEIYSDVDGVFDADPRIVPGAALIGEIGYEEMQELSEAGAHVLHPAAVEFAKKNDAGVQCRNTSRPDKNGTIIRNVTDKYRPRVIGVASEQNVVLVHVWEGDNIRLGTVKNVLAFCEQQRIRVKQTTFHRGKGTQMVGSFIISGKDYYRLDVLLAEMNRIFGGSVDIHEGYSAVSLIGAGITADTARLISAVSLLRENGIPVGSFHTSSFRISLLVGNSDMERTVSLLHETFIENDRGDQFIDD